MRSANETPWQMQKHNTLLKKSFQLLYMFKNFLQENSGEKLRWELFNETEQNM